MFEGGRCLRWLDSRFFVCPYVYGSCVLTRIKNTIEVDEALSLL